MRLTGKTIVMIAAAMGIGRTSAIAILKEGATVYAADIDKDELDTYE